MANKTGAQFFPNLTVEVTLNVICSTLFLSESILQTAVQEEIVQGFAFQKTGNIRGYLPQLLLKTISKNKRTVKVQSFDATISRNNELLSDSSNSISRDENDSNDSNSIYNNNKFSNDNSEFR